MDAHELAPDAGSPVSVLLDSTEGIEPEREALPPEPTERSPKWSNEPVQEAIAVEPGPSQTLPEPMPEAIKPAIEPIPPVSKPLPPPLGQMAAKRMGRPSRASRAKDFAATATASVLAGKNLPVHANRPLPLAVRAELNKILGPDIDQFRLLLADTFLAMAQECAEHIRADLPNQKPETRAFTMSVLIDKSEALRGKLSSNPRTAAVNVQVNIGSDAELRAQLLAALSPSASPVNVTPALAGAKAGAD